MNISAQNLLSLIANFAVGFFFLSVLSIKGGHNFAPILLIALGVGYGIYGIIKKFSWRLDKADKLLIYSYIFYFAIFLLSLFINGGKAKELDNPSRVLLLIPALLMLLRIPVKLQVCLYAIPVGAIVTGLVALYDRFILHSPAAFAPRIMQIQGGDIAMSLGIFSLVLAFYFILVKNYRITALPHYRITALPHYRITALPHYRIILCIIASLFGILGSFLSTARGGWIGLPVILIVLLWIYRHSLSKKFIVGLVGIFVIGIIILVNLPNSRVMERFYAAQSDISLYMEGNAATSLGARFDMWKSAVLMAEEKPIFGWGIEGVKEKRQQQANENIISHMAGQFGHAHNQYLDDLSKRGIIGLLALLGIFLVPLRNFIQGLSEANQTNNNEKKLLATLGIIHILSVMFYCVSQGFFTHNSGNIFYFFLVVVFYAMMKTVNQPQT